MSSEDRHVSSLLLLALPLLLLLSVDGRRHGNPCSGSCVCMSGLVTCRRSDLIAIPSNFGVDTHHLIMLKQPFIDKTLRRHNISYLQRLTKLDLKGCGIEALEVGVFSGLRRLRSVDLSDNNLRVVQDFTFRGLSLKFLFLNNNRALRLGRRAFHGLVVDGLSMENCGLRAVAYDTFLALNASVRSLWLTGNELVEFDPRFEALFGHLDTLEVRGNPFRCKCRLRWLVRYLRAATSRQRPAISLNPSPSERPRCAAPPALAGIELQALDPAQLTCDPPRLGDVEVAVLSADAGRLRCAASGYPRPVIAWRRAGPAGGAGQLLRLVQPGRGPGPGAAEVAVDRQRRSETYECLASNVGGNVSLTVRLRWPPRAPPTPPRRPPVPPEARRPTVVSPDGPGPGREWRAGGADPALEEEANPFFQKKFTLLELIGAVVGTFTATLGLFLLVCWCIAVARKKQKKQQWSTYESAYSGSHVYDVPRHDQASYMAAKSSHAGTANRHEFLDFKTGRKVYDQV